MSCSMRGVMPALCGSSTVNPGCPSGPADAIERVLCGRDTRMACLLDILVHDPHRKFSSSIHALESITTSRSSLLCSQFQDMVICSARSTRA